MGIVFQDVKLLQDRTVSENMAFALEVTGHFPKEVKKKVSEILNRLGFKRGRRIRSLPSPPENNNGWRLPEPWSMTLPLLWQMSRRDIWMIR